MIFSLILLVIVSGACVCAADDNSTPVAADSSDDTAADTSDDSSDDEEGSTGDEEIALDVTVDENEDEPAEESSNESDDNAVSVKLTEHATGIPVFMLLLLCLLPILRRE